MEHGENPKDIIERIRDEEAYYVVIGDKFVDEEEPARDRVKRIGAGLWPFLKSLGFANGVSYHEDLVSQQEDWDSMDYHPPRVQLLTNKPNADFVTFGNMGWRPESFESAFSSETRKHAIGGLLAVPSDHNGPNLGFGYIVARKRVESEIKDAENHDDWDWFNVFALGSGYFTKKQNTRDVLGAHQRGDTLEHMPW